MKFAVGVMLSPLECSGVRRGGANWPGGDAALLALIPVVLIAANVIVWMLRRAVPLAGSRGVGAVETGEAAGASA